MTIIDKNKIFSILMDKVENFATKNLGQNILRQRQKYR